MSLPENGKVFLIGAGPGDPELMTLKAARALRLADVVLVDDLVNRGCLAHARSDAKVIEVGKRGGYASTPQVFIERLMVHYAKAGNTVARLKGGDPFVFGRGGEELQALAAEGIDVEIIPGVTAGLGAPAALGIPVTHRGVASGVTFVTGHTQEGIEPRSESRTEPRGEPRSEPNWEALARSGTTLVIYMGLRRLKEISRALMKAGMAPDTPACAIQNGTLQTQRELVSTLRELAKDVLREKIEAPAIVVIGDVVAFSRIKIRLPAQRAA
jgi:uroporphyrin-III C-methyltransferase